MRVSSSPRHRYGYFIAALAATSMVLAACSSSPSSSGGGGIKSGGSLTFALDEDVAGFNPLFADDNEFVLAEIQDQVYPQIFVVQLCFKHQLNTEIVTSAKVT